MKRCVSCLLALLAILAAVSCRPRGDVSDSGQALLRARASYQLAGSGRPAQHAQELHEIEQLIDALLGERDSMRSGELALVLAGRLTALMPAVTLPTRPALSEVIIQCRHAITAVPAAEVRPAEKERLKQLASRVFNLLASELQTSAFGTRPQPG